MLKVPRKWIVVESCDVCVQVWVCGWYMQSLLMLSPCCIILTHSKIASNLSFLQMLVDCRPARLPPPHCLSYSHPFFSLSFCYSCAQFGWVIVFTVSENWKCICEIFLQRKQKTTERAPLLRLALFSTCFMGCCVCVCVRTKEMMNSNIYLFLSIFFFFLSFCVVASVPSIMCLL